MGWDMNQSVAYHRLSFLARLNAFSAARSLLQWRSYKPWQKCRPALNTAMQPLHRNVITIDLLYSIVIVDYSGYQPWNSTTAPCKACCRT